MIALISSTIYPLSSTPKTLYRGVFSHEERLAHTIETVKSLLKYNFDEIFIFDNSGFNWVNGTEDYLFPAKVIQFNAYQFINKGLSEIYMLLSGLSMLPEDVPVFKISGRYTLNKSIYEVLLADYDFAVKMYHEHSQISTRGYYAKNKQILEKLFIDTLNYIYSYSHKVLGPRSFIRVTQDAFFLKPNRHNFFDPTIAIEYGMYKVLQNFRVKELDKLFIKGILANPYAEEIIDE